VSVLDGSAEERARLHHDLQARLTVIVGYADLLRTRTDETVRQEGLKRIMDAAELLGRDLTAAFGNGAATPSRRERPRPLPATPVQLLLIDDDDELRTLLRLTLPEDDFVVRDTSDGGEGVLLVEELAPALVLLDWNMPARSGADVLEELKQRWPRLPVVVLTAEGRASEREHAERLGANAFLRKPFSPIELLETIGRLLSERLPDKPA